MRNLLIVIGIIIGSGFQLNAQTMVGLSKEEVAARVKKEHKEFQKDESVIKQRFNYLKYVNSMRSRTWILYFDDQDYCKTSKLICDYSDYVKVLDDVGSRCEKTGESIWQYVSGQDTIQVEVIK